MPFPSMFILALLALLMCKLYERPLRLAIARWLSPTRCTAFGLSRAEMALLIVIGLGLLVLVRFPEGRLLLTVIDAVGLDIVSLLILFQLRHYATTLHQVVFLPILRRIYRLQAFPIPEPYSKAYRGMPLLRAYVLLWPLIVIVAWPLLLLVMGLTPGRVRGYLT
jgi:hypothetical protein